MRVSTLLAACCLAGGCVSPLAQTPADRFVARSIAVSPDAHAAYLACLRQRALPGWQALERRGSLTALRIFETGRVVRGTEASAEPKWSLLMLAQLSASGRAPALAAAALPCDSMAGVSVRREERMRATPGALHPRPGARPPREDVQHIVEYINVGSSPAAQQRYRFVMERVMGPAVGEVIQLGALDYLVALETEAVTSSDLGQVSWNQIHVRGVYPEVGPRPPQTNAIIGRLAPEIGSREQLFRGLDEIRVHTREDEARELPGFRIGQWRAPPP